MNDLDYAKKIVKLNSIIIDIQKFLLEEELNTQENINNNISLYIKEMNVSNLNLLMKIERKVNELCR